MLERRQQNATLLSTPVEHAALILGAIGIAINDAAGRVGAVNASARRVLGGKDGRGGEGREG